MSDRPSSPWKPAAVAAGFLITFLTIGCAKPPQGPPTTLGPAETLLILARERVATVYLTIDANGNISGIGKVISDDKSLNGAELALSKSKKDFAHWRVDPPNADVRLEIGMKTSDSPFAEPPKSLGNHVVSGPVRSDVPDGKKYNYWVKVHDNKQNRDFQLDPPIRIDP